MNRNAKISLSLIALYISTEAFLDPDKFFFTWKMSAFGAIMSWLAMYAYRKDKILRMILLTICIYALNSLIDEIFGDPYTLGINEKIFGILAAINLIYHTKKYFIGWIRSQI